MLTGSGATDELETLDAWRLSPGSRLDCWEIQAEVGRGSTGVVYRALDLRTGEVVALKCVGHAGAEALKREFRVLGGLRHPNLVKLRELRQLGSSTFFSMDFVDGVGVLAPFAALAPEERPLAVRRVFAQLADALVHLHGAGLAHRDVKPANVMVDRSGKLVLLDFGLTRTIEPDLRAPSGAVSGTLAYLAPERFRGAPAEPAADWFAFGVLLFEALAGELPFGPDSQQTVMAWYLGKPVSDLEARLGPSAQGFAPLLQRVLDPRPEARADGAEVLAALHGQRREIAARQVFGREDDQAWLEQHALARSGRVVLALTGESGVGKTTLLRELERHCRRQGQRVLRSHCHPREQLPFNALNAIAIDLLELTASSQGSGDDDIVWAERRVAEVFAAAHPGGARSGTPEEVARALHALLAASARRQRLLLCIDDAQWIDKDSLRLLELLLTASDPDCCWIFAVRGGSADVPDALRPHVQAERRLERLAASAALGLIRALRPTLSPADAERISAMAGGHPLAIEQACSWSGVERALTAWGSPEELLAAQASERSEHQRALLALLAVHESSMPAEVLYACKLRSVSDVHELLDAGLVNFERGDAAQALSVRHARLAESVRSGLAEDEIGSLHGRIADGYLAVGSDDVEAVFRHLVGARREAEALPYGLRSARSFRDRLAFERASERLSWLIEHESSAERRYALEVELADVLGRAGSAGLAADAYRRAVELAPERERLNLRRNAAEQLLRAGKVDEGRALLALCAREVGLHTHSSGLGQILGILVRRLRIAGVRPELGRERAAPPEPVRRRMEVAWSAGLGLNLVDVLESAVAQSQFTALALRHGDREQALRAWAVEYSFTMNASGTRAQQKGDAIRELLAREVEQSGDGYTRAIALLSWAAGDYFRGSPELALAKIREARAAFATMLGTLSWELANCGLYEMWSLLELAELDEFVARVPDLLRTGDERGDALYRRYWISGYCGTAWLVQDRPDELAERLARARGSASAGRFEMADVFDLIAHVRADLYRGRAAQACETVERAWRRVRASGLERLQWFRFSLTLLRLQSALALPGVLHDRARLERWAARLGRCPHPAAPHWAAVFGCLIAARDTRGRRRLDVARLLAGASGLEACGQRLGALGIRHELSRHGLAPAPRWPASVVAADGLARAVAVSLMP
jgi:eukaryotic-like serine/threonine-protein kinase